MRSTREPARPTRPPPQRPAALRHLRLPDAAGLHHQPARRDLAKRVDAAFDKRMAGGDQEIADLVASRAKLEAESDKLLAAHFADAIDLPTLKRHQDRIRAGLADVNQRLRPIRRRRPALGEPGVLQETRHHRRRTTTSAPGRAIRPHHPRGGDGRRGRGILTGTRRLFACRVLE